MKYPLKCPLCGDDMVDGMWFTAEDGVDDDHGLYCCHEQRCIRWMCKKTQIPLRHWSRMLDYVKGGGTWGPSHTRSVRVVRMFRSAVEVEAKEVKVEVEAKEVKVEASTRARVKRKRTREGPQRVRRKRKRLCEQEKHLPQTLDVRIAQLVAGIAHLTQAVQDLTKQIVSDEE